ncbi:MAG: DegT/DnrJ/EryC1/StrS family aminotransferase [Defluviitaleaceae bacterium]|nr:DegT/DnrJ/EryC1/StrS family aminotransferase [Defluviitaleaceae bacterium]
MIPVTRSSMPPFEKYVNRIAELWETRWLTNSGKMHEELSEKLKKFFNVNVQLFANGHIALEAGIRALELSGEVITTPFTFASTTQAIVRSGLTPVFCDIDAKTFNIDATKIESLITEKTSAILAVHVYGIPCDVVAIEKIAQKHNLKVIYDAAHAFGVNYLGRSIAEFGDLSMFSFHATKVFHTVEGGCCAFADKGLSSKLASQRNFGFNPDATDVISIGGNGKMSEFHAAMGLCNLEIIEAEIEKRKKVSERYDKILCGVEGLQTFSLIGKEKGNENERAIGSAIDGELKRNYAYYPVKILPTFGKSRDCVADLLKSQGIIARKYFYPLTSDFECFKGKYRGNTPVAEDVAAGILCLPLYADLAETEVICKILCEATGFD